MAYNIIIVEDDKQIRTQLAEGLQEDYGHHVKVFRDVVSLEGAINEKLFGKKESNNALIVILDIMLAMRLPEGANRAERWQGESHPTRKEKEGHLDDVLGLNIGKRIRQGGFEPLIPRNAPLLMFSARNSTDIGVFINEKLGNAAYLEKPVFVRDLILAIDNLIDPVKCKKETHANEK
jgi:CheY-like chemotaxis protein